MKTMTVGQVGSFLYGVVSAAPEWLHSQREAVAIAAMGLFIAVCFVPLMVRVDPISQAMPGGNPTPGRRISLAFDRTELPTRSDFLHDYSIMARNAAILSGGFQLLFLVEFLFTPDLQAATRLGFVCDITAITAAFCCWWNSMRRRRTPDADRVGITTCLLLAVVVMPPALMNQLGLSPSTTVCDRYFETYGFISATTTTIGLALGAILQRKPGSATLRMALGATLGASALLVLSTVALRHNPFADMAHIYAHRSMEDGWTGVFCVSNFAAAFAILAGLLRRALFHAETLKIVGGVRVGSRAAAAAASQATLNS